MNLWRNVTNLLVGKTLRMGRGAVIKVVNSDNTESTVDLTELAALDGIAAADLAKIDGITNGTAAAGKALVLGASGEIATITSATITSLTCTTAAIGATTLDATDAGKIDGITNGTGAANKALVLDASGNVAMPDGGFINLSNAALAAAGAAQATYAVIADQINAVTGADNTVGVALPAASAGRAIFIVNTSSTNTLPVAPVNGGNDQINSLTAGTGVFTMGPSRSAWFIPTSATQWYVTDDATITASFTEINLTDGATFTTQEANTLSGVPVSVTGATVSTAGSAAVGMTFLDASGITAIGTAFIGRGYISTTASGTDFGVVSGITATTGVIANVLSGAFDFITTTSGRLGLNVVNGASTNYITFNMPGGKIKVSPAVTTS